ncbi:MAG TPA: ABC transporter substrate-binding protein [Trebonia sp.]|jgi:ABC-type branched-subunit amino acid transport system substrate-binding protein|nr:ABC transporter substrate-binding protein [Trebonia sp.]
MNVAGALAAAIACAFGLAACSSSNAGTTSGGSAGASGGAPFVVGATEDLSGPLAAYGANVHQAFSVAFNAANAKGGVNGHNVNLVIKDDQSVLTTALSNTRALLSQHVVVTTGSTLSDFCSGIEPVVTAAQTPEICTNVDPKSLSPVEPYLFDMNPPEAMTAQPILQFGQKQSGVAKPRVGIMVAGAGGSIDFGNAAEAYAKAQGWSVSDLETTSATTVTLPTGQVAKLAASKPDMVVVEETPDNTTALVTDLRQDGYRGPVIAQNPDFPGLAQTKDANFFMADANQYVAPNATQSGAAEYVAQMKAAGVTSASDLNNGQVVLDWVRAQDILAALKKCGGSCDGVSMQKALESTTISLPGVVDQYGYSATSHVPVSTVYIYGWDAASAAPKLEEPAAPMGSL